MRGGVPIPHQKFSIISHLWHILIGGQTHLVDLLWLLWLSITLWIIYDAAIQIPSFLKSIQ